MYVVLKVQKPFYSSLAQSVEHAAVNRSVVGSSPTQGVRHGRKAEVAGGAGRKRAPWSSG